MALGAVVLMMDGAVELLDGWEAEAHHHAGLAVAAAGGEEGLVRGREMKMWPGPIWEWSSARDFDPLPDLSFFLLWPFSFLLSSQVEPFLL